MRKELSCYCSYIDRQLLENEDLPLGFCGLCDVCGNPGHVRHHPGAVPYTGCWCPRHYRILALTHPKTPVGCLLWIALGVAAALCVSSVARASPPPRPVIVEAPQPNRATSAEVAQESVGIACDKTKRDTHTCTVEATYVYHNPTDETIELTVCQSQCTAFVLAPGASKTHVVKSTAVLRKQPLRPFALLPLAVRHPVLAEDTLADMPTLVYVMSAPKVWANVVTPDLTICAASNFQPVGDAWERLEEGCSRWRGHASGATSVSIALRYDQILRWGGPFIAVGGTRDEGITLRGGYEFGLGNFVLNSVSVESDFDERLTAGAVVEGALPTFMFVPSVGLGAGTVVDIRPRARVGTRLQVSTSLFATFVGLFDYFPSDRDWRISLMAQVGL